MGEWLALVLMGGGGNIRTQTFCHALYALREENEAEEGFLEDDYSEDAGTESLPSSAESSPPLTPICGLFPLTDVPREATTGFKLSLLSRSYSRGARRSDFGDDALF